MTRVHKIGLAILVAVIAAFGISLAAVTAASSTTPTPLEAAKTAKADADATLAAAQKADASAAATVAAIEAGQPKEEPPPKEETTGTWRGFTASNPMPATQTPFASTSFINQRVPANPTVLANSKAIVEFVGTLNNIWTDGGYDRPIYYASTTDPVLEVSGIKYGTWANGLKIHVPAKAAPAPAPCWPGCSADHHIGIVQPNGELLDFWAVTKVSEGKLVAGGAGYAHDFGTSSGVSEREAGSTASGFNNMTGVIRPEELAAGRINHALTGPVHLTRSGCHIAPATGSDGTSSSANAPCQGQRFYLEYTPAEIAAKSWPRWEKTIVSALAEYGYYADDSGGGGGFTIKLEGPIDRTAFGLPNPFNEALKGEPGMSEATGAGGKAYILNLAGVEWTRLRAIA